MELPPALRLAVDRALDGVSTDRLATAFQKLSARYRAEQLDADFHVAEDESALAYLATRLPATYAAIRDACSRIADRLPDFAPASQLDLGAGPGTAAWAARDEWPSLARIELVEGSAAMRRWGARLAEGTALADAAWTARDLRSAGAALPGAELVTIGYVLDELDPLRRQALVDLAWKATSSVLLIVEPGTPAGWQRILAVRGQLLAAGAHVIAPCAHALPCPVSPPDWCHFSRRVARSRLHQRGKSAVVPFEDEKFVYAAFSRDLLPAATGARVLSPPRTASGRVALKLCQPDGSLAETLITRRDGDRFRDARRADWGDVVEG